MNDEKKYNEALKRARKLYEQGTITESLCYVFPELKESEDEKIRKELIEYIKDQQSSFISAPDCRDEYEEEENNKYNSWIAWLEKQGDKPQGKTALEAIKEEKVDNQNCVKSADKVNPKFKVGDWVVFDNCNVEHITSVGTHGYTFDDGDYLLHDECDKIAHLWSIQDAKDGDVLVCPKYASDIIPNIFIFKNINIKDNDVFCYCSFLETFRTQGYIANADPINTDFYPATKEQRDTLIKAMADAGYAFDFEKKELKKIEQKPAWSEEDSIRLQRIIDFLWHNRKGDTDTIYQQEQDIDWLKSLKDRITWKPSEEQMKALHNLNLTGHLSYAGQGQELIDLYNDLKELKV